jgi:hypothetical protein
MLKGVRGLVAKQIIAPIQKCSEKKEFATSETAFELGDSMDNRPCGICWCVGIADNKLDKSN